MGKPSCDETTYGPGAATSGVALRLQTGGLLQGRREPRVNHTMKEPVN